MPFSLHGFPAPFQRRFPALLFRIFAGYPMQTVIQFSRFNEGSEIRLTHSQKIFQEVVPPVFGYKKSGSSASGFLLQAIEKIVSHRKFYFQELVVPVLKKYEVNFKVKSELLVPVLRINVISNFGCRSLCMDFLPPSGSVFRLSLSGSWPGIPCRRSFDFQGTMKACRKHITIK